MSSADITVASELILKRDSFKAELAAAERDMQAFVQNVSRMGASIGLGGGMGGGAPGGGAGGMAGTINPMGSGLSSAVPAGGVMPATTIINNAMAVYGQGPTSPVNPWAMQGAMQGGMPGVPYGTVPGATGNSGLGMNWTAAAMGTVMLSHYAMTAAMQAARGSDLQDDIAAQQSDLAVPWDQRRTGPETSARRDIARRRRILSDTKELYNSGLNPVIAHVGAYFGATGDKYHFEDWHRRQERDIEGEEDTDRRIHATDSFLHLGRTLGQTNIRTGLIGRQSQEISELTQGKGLETELKKIQSEFETQKALIQNYALEYQKLAREAGFSASEASDAGRRFMDRAMGQLNTLKPLQDAQAQRDDAYRQSRSTDSISATNAGVLESQMRAGGHVQDAAAYALQTHLKLEVNRAREEAGKLPPGSAERARKNAEADALERAAPQILAGYLKETAYANSIQIAEVDARRSIAEYDARGEHYLAAQSRIRSPLDFQIKAARREGRPDLAHELELEKQSELKNLARQHDLGVGLVNEDAREQEYRNNYQFRSAQASRIIYDTQRDLAENVGDPAAQAAIRRRSIAQVEGFLQQYPRAIQTDTRSLYMQLQGAVLSDPKEKKAEDWIQSNAMAENLKATLREQQLAAGRGRGGPGRKAGGNARPMDDVDLGWGWDDRGNQGAGGAGGAASDAADKIKESAQIFRDATDKLTQTGTLTVVGNSLT